MDSEADILLDLARLRRDASQTLGVSETSRVSRDDEPLRLANEALAITERSGYALQGADVRLFLAQLALDSGDRTAALAHARLARQLAACDGPPDYTYKATYEEAGALVGRLEHEVTRSRSSAWLAVLPVCNAASGAVSSWLVMDKPPGLHRRRGRLGERPARAAVVFVLRVFAAFAPS